MAFIIIISISIILISICVVWFLSTISAWRSCPNDSTKISFNTFIKFYNIAPDKWELREDYVKKLFKRNGMSSYFYEKKSFYFPFRDYLKYQSWYNKKIKEKQQNYNNEVLTQLIEEVKKELDEYNEKGLK